MNFWDYKTLNELSHDEWEALCDGCGLCCLNKIQDEDDDLAPIYLTRVVCRCYDLTRQECQHYANRTQTVEGCVALTPHGVASYDWLPKTCAYRLIFEGQPLYPWHPLVSGTRESVKPHSLMQYEPVMEDASIDLEDYIIWEE